MNSTNCDIIKGTKYEWPGGALTPRTVARKVVAPVQNHDTPNNNLIPYGYCQCGCGEKTAIAPKTDRSHGYIKGEPRRFVLGHHICPPAGTPEYLNDLDCYRIPLPHDRYALVSKDDLALAHSHKWHASKSNSKDYVRAKTPEGNISMHRVITGAPEGMLVDHINGDGLDNRRSNLRVCTHSENLRNRKGVTSLNTSGFLGVSRNKGTMRKWEAMVVRNGRKEYRARFFCPIEAAIARDIAAIEIHGEFASLNFPELREVFS